MSNSLLHPLDVNAESSMDFDVPTGGILSDSEKMETMHSPKRFGVAPKLFLNNDPTFEEHFSHAVYSQSQPKHMSSLIASAFCDDASFSLRSPARVASDTTEEDVDAPFIEPLDVDKNVSPVEAHFGDSSDALAKQYEPELFYAQSPPCSMFTPQPMPKLREHGRSMSADFSCMLNLGSSDVQSDSEIETHKSAPKQRAPPRPRQSQQQKKRQQPRQSSPKSTTKRNRHSSSKAIRRREKVDVTKSAAAASSARKKAEMFIENELAVVHKNGVIQFKCDVSGDPTEIVVPFLRSYPHPEDLNVIAEPEYVTVRVLNSDNEEEVDYVPQPAALRVAQVPLLQRIAEEAIQRQSEVRAEQTQGITTPGFRLVCEDNGESGEEEEDDGGLVGSGANFMAYVGVERKAVKKSHIVEQVFEDSVNQAAAQQLSRDIENFVMPTGPRARKKAARFDPTEEAAKDAMALGKISKRKLGRVRKRKKSSAFEFSDDYYDDDDDSINTNSSSATSKRASSFQYVDSDDDESNRDEEDFEEDDDDDDFDDADEDMFSVKNNSSSSSSKKNCSSSAEREPKRAKITRQLEFEPEAAAEQSASAMIKCGFAKNVRGSYKLVDCTKDMVDMVDKIINEYTEFSRAAHNKGVTGDDYYMPFSLFASGRHGNPSTSHAPSSLNLVRMLRDLVKEHATELVARNTPRSNLAAYAMQFGRVVTRGSEVSAQVDTKNDHETYARGEIPVGIVLNAHSVPFEAVLGCSNVTVKPRQVLIFDKRIDHSMRKAVVKKANAWQCNTAKRFECVMVFNTIADSVRSGGGARGLDATTLKRIFDLQAVPYKDWMVYNQKWCRHIQAPPATSWYPPDVESATMREVREHWINEAFEANYLKSAKKNTRYISHANFPKYGHARPLKDKSLSGAFAQPACSQENREMFSWQSIAEEEEGGGDEEDE